MNIVLIILIYIISAPLLGGLLSGLDRKISARMQSRVGPPLIQPFYDVLKLVQKENLVVRRSQNFYIFFYLIAMIFSGAIFYSGENILLFVFALTLAEVFFVLGGYKASSPYSFIGAERELIQIMAYDPVLFLAAIGMYMATRSFYISDIVAFTHPLVFYLPGLFLGVIFILAIKFRKSPFDLSTSHHAHQELVKGLTTEFSGRALAMIEIAHWYDTVLILSCVYLFFASSLLFALTAVFAAYFLLILIDNTFARVKWQLTLKSAWAVSLLFGLTNIIVLFLFNK